MKPVAIVCGAGLVSGKEVMALQLGEGLRQAGFEVSFVTSRWGTGEFGRTAEAKGFHATRMWLGFISATLRLDCIWMTLDQLVHWPALLGRFRAFLRERKPDRVIHTNWHHALLLWPLLKKERDIFWIHETLPNAPSYRRVMHLLGARVSQFVAVSEASAGSLLRLGIGPGFVQTIWNGIEDPVRTREVLKNEAPVIGIVGQVGRWKGHENLLDAFEVVRRALPQARLEIFGKGLSEYEKELRRRISDSGMDGAVVWHGFVDDRQSIYPRLRLLAVPSLSEDPLPTSAIEAAFFGVPVVASRGGGLPEIVEDGVTGYLIDPTSPAEFGAKMIEVLSRDDVHERMSAESRRRALKRFSRERFVRQFVEVLTNPRQ